MDYQRFIEQLPSLYENWGQESVRPKSNRFQQVLDQVQGMTTANVMQLLNFAVECMEPDELYCEIGSYQGATLIGSLLTHPNRAAYAVDNFCEYDPAGENFDKLIENLSKFSLQEQVYFCNQDFEQFLLELRDLGTEDKIGVYFYDGAHDYRSHLLGLLLVRPFLAHKALIIVDDSNWSTVQQANWDFIAANPECQVLLDLPTPVNRSPTFWNGIQILSWDGSRSSNYPSSTFRQVCQQPVVQAIYNLHLLEQRENISTLYQEALLLHRQRQFAAAEEKYRELLLWKDSDAEAWLNLGILYSEVERYQEAIESLLNSLKFDASNPLSYYTLGLVFEKIDNTHQAILAYQEALKLDPKLIDAYNNLGNLLTQTGEIAKAEAVYRQAIAANSSHFGSYLNLGNLLLEQNQVEQAIEAYQTALVLNPTDSDIFKNLEFALEAKNNPDPFLLNLGNKFYQQGRYQEASERYQEFLELQTGNAELYFNLSECFRHLNRIEDAISTLREGIDCHPLAGKLHFYLIKILQQSGRNQEAISSAEIASQLIPYEYVFKILKHLMLPIVYDSVDEISFFRQRFVQGLQALIQQTSLETPEDKRNALAGIGCVTNFYLAYQAHNVLESQCQYGNLVHQIMAANYPKWVESLPMPPLKKQNKIRVGYMSAYLHTYSGTLWLVGWLRHCDRQKFEVYCYYTGNQPDAFTQHLRDYSDAFHRIPGNLEAVCKQIVSDQLHILVFPEIGMDPPTMQIAGLRLAPVQCTAWGHPVTTGLPTIDYFLSSELMEPENAQEHYSEVLVRLPNIGVAYPKPAVGQLTKTRSDFQLREDAVIYLCCQAPFKYLPQYDFIFAEIARRVPHAQFIFLRGTALKQRLRSAFDAVGLNSEDYCVFLSIPTRPDYLAINLLSDVFLDTFTWSGGNTALEAIACNLPIVTCPGEFMRGRHAYSFLKMLGVTDTIAQTEAEYIEIAVKLGLDPEWRLAMVEQIKVRHDYLYDDKACVEALEAFYKQVVQERLMQT